MGSINESDILPIQVIYSRCLERLCHEWFEKKLNDKEIGFYIEKLDESMRNCIRDQYQNLPVIKEFYRRLAKIKIEKTFTTYYWKHPSHLGTLPVVKNNKDF